MTSCCHKIRPSRGLLAASWLLAWWMLAVMIVTGPRLVAATSPSGFVLEIEMANAQGGLAQVFYNTGYGYSPLDSSTAQIPPGTDLKPMRFPIPALPIKHVRLDPAVGESTVQIGYLRLYTSDGRLLQQVHPSHLRAMFDIRAISVANDIATIRTGRTDPMLLLDESFHAATEQALGRQTVGYWGVTIVSLLVLGLVALTTLAAARVAMKLAGGKSDVRSWACWLGIFLFVFGARAFWLSRYSVSMPFWDEWDSDALFLLIPLRGGFLDWQSLFIPQSEHRILITRCVTLLGTILNGEWDPRIGMLVGAAMAGATVATIAVVISKTGRFFALVIGTLLAVAWALPFDFENLLWGGQSQMYALNLLAVCTLVFAVADRPGVAGTCFAFLAGLLSIFTMGAGFITPAVAALICGFRARTEHRRKEPLVLMTMFAALALFGLGIRETSHWHAPSYAHSLGEGWRAFVHYGSWPLNGTPITLSLIWLPILAAIFVAVVQRNPRYYLAIGIGAWAMIMALGLAHGRPTEVPPIQSKYFTAISTAVLSVVLTSAAIWRSRVNAVVRLIVIAGCASLLVAMITFGWRGVGGAHFDLERKTRIETTIRRYLASGDRSIMQDLPPLETPYWNSAEAAERMDSPLLRPWLPASYRRALNIRGAGLNPVAGPISRFGETLMTDGLLLAGVGLGLFLLSLKLTDKHGDPDTARVTWKGDQKRRALPIAVTNQLDR